MADTHDAISFSDIALRAAVLSEHAGSTLALWQMDDAALSAWAAATPIPSAALDRLAWGRESLLHRVVPEVVRDLSGAERLTQLRVLDLPESELAVLPEAVFASLTRLEAAYLGVTPATDLAPLEACPALRRVVLRGLDEASHGAARARLEARGVVVDAAGLPRPSPAPFKDPILRLAVLDALHTSGRIELPPLIALDELRLDEEHLQRLLRLPISSEQLESIEELVWSGGGMELQHLVWPQFDGESDDFVIRSLGGLDALPNLRSLVLQWMDVEYDAGVLAALEARGVSVQIE